MLNYCGPSNYSCGRTKRLVLSQVGNCLISNAIGQFNALKRPSKKTAHREPLTSTGRWLERHQCLNATYQILRQSAKTYQGRLMAGDWIKMRNNLRDDPAVIYISNQTNLCRDTVVGKLHRIWSWADEHTTDGNAVGVTEMFVDLHVEQKGFAKAMLEVGWLKTTKSGISIPDFDVHNGNTAKRRALNAQRQRKYRNAPVTPEATQKEHSNVTHSSLSLISILKEGECEGEGGGLTFPPSLNTPECKRAWGEWLEHKANRKENYSSRKSQEKMLTQLAQLGAKRFIAAVNYSIGRDWSGVYEEKNGNGHKPDQPVKQAKEYKAPWEEDSEAERQGRESLSVAAPVPELVKGIQVKGVNDE